MSEQLPFITSIQYIDLEDAASLDTVPFYGVILPDTLPLRTFPLYGIASYTCEQSGSGGDTTWTVEIQGRCHGGRITSARPLAFIATTADGRRLLIGRQLRPAPVLHQNSKWSDSPGASSYDNFTIIHEAPHPPIDII